MKPYFTDEQATLYLGDALTALQSLPDASINCCVTSPPYFGLRDYGNPGQYGLEASPAEYVERMRVLFAEVRRVLANDGTLWLNIGDSYVGNPNSGSASLNRKSGDGKHSAGAAVRVEGLPIKGGGLPPKSLLGIPWRVAFALQDDGWTLRNDIIWAKPNGMPESVTDRLSTKHEHLFLFAKSRRYWFDLDPIREEAATADRDGPRRSYAHGSASSMNGGEHQVMSGPFAELPLNPKGRNPGDVWTIPTQPFTEAHFAVFPVEIPRRAIAAGCKPGGVVLDPFSGSGTTGLAAAELGRRYVGIDLNRDYLELSLRTRLSQPSLTAEVGS